MTVHVRSAVILALTLVPSVAVAAPRHVVKLHKKQARVSKEAAPRGCLKAPVEVVAGGESAKFALAKCDGGAPQTAIDQLSSLSHAPASRRLDGKLVERLEVAVDHFRKGAELARVVLISGYRPRSAGSFHSVGRALDFRIDGVTNEALVAFCKTLPDTGCGYYPNSGFVHMDVRDPGTGHVAWTDVSHPGEAPHYVKGESDDAPTLPSLPTHDGPKKADATKAEVDDHSHAL